MWRGYGVNAKDRGGEWRRAREVVYRYINNTARTNNVGPINAAYGHGYNSDENLSRIRRICSVTITYCGNGLQGPIETYDVKSAGVLASYY